MRQISKHSTFASASPYTGEHTYDVVVGWVENVPEGIV